MKKIAIVADGWRRMFNYGWIAGCRNFIREHNLDIDIYVFNSFGNFSKDEKYNFGEYNITNLTDFKEFDGIILELTNIFLPEVKKQIIDKVLRSGVPAVSLVEELPGMYYTGINNYGAMEQLIEHLITVHGCKVLNFAGASMENEENRERLQAYRDVLRRHNIEVDENRIFSNNYEIETGEMAFEYYKRNNLMADAIVCANDNIAVGICHQSTKYGYSVPQDFLVTGFDDFDKACYYNPRITTVGFERELIAYNAVKLLQRIWNGENVERKNYATPTCVFQESCGCVAEHPADRGQYVIEHIFEEVRESNMMNELLELKRDLIDCDSYEEMAECLPRYLSGLECQQVVVVMNTDILETENFTTPDNVVEDRYIKYGYPDKMTALLACDRGNVERNLPMKSGNLIPESMLGKLGNLFVISPLHFREREVGYITFTNCDYLLKNQFLFDTLNTFQESLEFLYGRVILKRMNKELSMLYVMDSLTGLYNRMAYNKLAIPLFEQCMIDKQPVMIMFVDVDRLKYINDNFGHDMGNLAIKTLATTIRQCCPTDAICMRYGGDEFVILAPDCEEEKAKELEQHMNEMVNRTSKALETGFDISASIGFVVAKNNEMTLNDYINLADLRMYETKKQKRIQREESQTTHRE